ncbi:MAG TPA: DNA recombination protein RmuC [Syntrophorhabdus sp.]|jgi:DNA recombination protein RmuC|nr:DNA recombination protein RmuC [Syntrophorhabdus sp.]HQO63876.1 DNA recombination protein RmuC [Syntrophorhabdus sp.]
METGLYIVGSAISGALIAWLIAFIRVQRRFAELENRAVSAETLAKEREHLVSQKNIELASLREGLALEKGLKIEAATRLEESQKNLQEQVERINSIEKKLVETFKALSLDALTKNTDEFKKYADEFIQLAEEKLKFQALEGKKELEGKKDLIDRSVQAIDKTLSEMQKKVEDVAKGNIAVSTLVQQHGEITTRLKETTERLSHVLASSKKRGEWGERMAEDIMRLIGMAEGVNYIRQKTLEGSSGRPDYTFLLPNKLKVNMDVKFPLDNYVHYLNAESDHERKRYREELLRNAKAMIRQVTSRDYINPSDNTVDYVIVFIPNEQVYSFINEAEPTIMDEALRQKVILCSPFTLYAVLSVIRQAIDNFNLEQTTSEILKLLAEFNKQWTSYKDKFRMMGDRLDAAKKEYDTLLTTRTTMLERPLKKIKELSGQQEVGIEETPALSEQQSFE